MATSYMLEIKNLKTHFYTEKGFVTAVDGVSLGVEKGEMLGLLGESGCGKSVTMQSVMRLLDNVKYEGEILFKDRNLLSIRNEEMRKIRGYSISMVFQDPVSSFNPVYTIGKQIIEAINIHQKQSYKEAYRKSVEMFKLVGLSEPDKRMKQYPFELSGGMRQRVLIAMGLMLQPDLLIADEPTSALDVTTQAQILDLINKINDSFNMGTIMISHDLGVIAEVCTRVAVMYLGQIIEEADVRTLFNNPLHPYTFGLMKSIPSIDSVRSKKLPVIKGMVPSLLNIPQGCRFVTRCSYYDKLCEDEEPGVKVLSGNHKVKCWHFEKIFNRG